MEYKELKGLVLADLHIGAYSSTQTRKEFLFLKDFMKDKYYSFIIIAGDYFDKKLYSNEEYVVIANELFLFLLSRCDKLRMVAGTKSHDNDQYKIFSQYENRSIAELLDNEIDFRVINTFEEEELFDELKVLYLPEEYIYDKKEYYKDILNKENEYDYVFGHGVIQEAMTNAVRATKKDSSKRKKAPVFNTMELSRICKGQVYFGHYHINTNINNKVFYVGIYCRYKIGEEEAKWFYEISTDGNHYINRFIENVSTEKYVQIPYSFNNEIFKSDIDVLGKLKDIIRKKDLSNIDHLKLIFNIPDEYPNPEFFINLVNDVFRDRDDIKVEITNGYIVTKRSSTKEEVKEVLNTYPYIFEKNSTPEENISYFIRDRYSKDVPVERVKKYLNFKALDLLNGIK